jgi:hypothetical protein
MKSNGAKLLGKKSRRRQGPRQMSAGATLRNSIKSCVAFVRRFARFQKRLDRRVPKVEIEVTNFRAAAFFDVQVDPIRKSSSRFPRSSCAVSHRGCLPRPDHVSNGGDKFRYFGKTVG